MTDAPVAPVAKVDPETQTIRSRPVRAIRFRRGVIIGIAALGSASLMTVAWVALKPRVFSAVADLQELSEPSNRPSTDALNRLPSTYAAVPKLGPPLPGDLGRPILAHQRAMATVTGGETSVDTASQAAAQERERQLAELKAARESGVLVQGRVVASPVTASTAAPSVDSPSMPLASPTPGTNGERNAQDRKTAFVAALDTRGDINPHPLVPSPSPYLLSAGSIISASLTTGLRSDLPGLVTAQVTSNVFDSPTGRIRLIPQGSRLVGSYDSVVAFGQKRALVVWQRIILPNGSSVRIDNAPATDASGYADLQDKVVFHTWALLKGVALATLLGVGSELSITGESDLVQAVRESAQQSVSRVGDRLTSRNLDIQPTITVRPGATVRLVVHKDLILAPWRK